MVKPGIDRHDILSSLFAGKRLGLITGSSGMSSDHRYTIDVLKEAFDLRALFGPEHGVRGVLGPGETVESKVDTLSGLPVYSLFGSGTRCPEKEILDTLDIVVFDLQDVGSRYFTYASSLFCLMKGCAEAGKKVVVLDRPNPLGGDLLEGNTHDEKLLSFIGLTKTPIRHGMTIGELGLYYNGEYGLGCDYTVVPLDGWKRSMYFDETGLPFIKASPNLPTFDSVVLYNGTCLFSGTNVSEGRGTTSPFSVVGAPYLNPITLSAEANRLGLPGVSFSPTMFMPNFSKYPGQSLSGVQIHVEKPHEVRPVELGVRLFCLIRDNYEEFAPLAAGQNGIYHVDRLSGSDELRTGKSADDILENWDRQAKAFRPIHDKYLLY